jgi:hypothetical protein
MKAILKKLLSGSILSLPAVSFLFFVQTFSGEYYFPMYMAQAVVFCLASVTAGVLLWHPYFAEASGWRLIVRILICFLIAWGISLMALGFFSLTPICVGQDNGDGHNNLMLCIIQFGLASITLTIPALITTSLASLFAGWLLSSHE